MSEASATDLIPYEDRDPFPMKISDGVRIRKTDSGYVMERLKANLTWEAFSIGSGGGGSFLSANTARVDPSGDDDTGTVGDLSKPFLTVQAALDAIVATVSEGIIDGVIELGATSYSEALTATLTGTTNVTISFLGLRGHGSYDYKAFDSLAITGGGTVELFIENCSLGGGAINSDSAQFFLYLHNVELGSCDITHTGSGTCSIGSRSNSSGGINSITADSASQITVFGLWSTFDPIVIGSASPNDPNIIVSNCNRLQVPENSSFTASQIAVNAPDATVTAIQSWLENLTCASATFIDSRASGTVTIDTPIVYQDVFLKAVPPGGTTGQALEKSSNDDFDTVWASLV